jgi:hypothetical protein
VDEAPRSKADLLTERSEADLLTEIARLYAALIRVVRTIDDPVLKAEIAALIWPPVTSPPPRRSRRMARYWKFIVAIVGAVVALVVALAGDGWFGQYGPVVVSFATAVGVLVKANTPPGPTTRQEVL